MKTLSDAGAKVDRVVVVIDRLEGANESVETAGFAFEALFTTNDLGRSDGSPGTTATHTSPDP